MTAVPAPEADVPRATFQLVPDTLPQRETAEPVDRTGRPLSWVWERSLARDLLGDIGGLLAVIWIALWVAWMVALVPAPERAPSVRPMQMPVR